MKKVFLLIYTIIFLIPSYGQAYSGISIAGVEYNVHYSHTGIEVSSITPQPGGSYKVNMYNTNYSDPYDGVSYQTSYTFDWYLSYKGKRVSDYFKSTIRCRKSEEKTVYAWPDEIPSGYERYVTIQFGKEPVKIIKDRRDDD